MATATLSRREALQKKTAALTHNFQGQLPKEFLFSLGGILQDMIIDSDEIDGAKVGRSEIKDLIIEMREGFRRMDERFEQVDKRFEQADKRFEAMQKQMDRRFEQMDKRFEQVDKRFEQVDKRFEAMQIQIDKRFEQVTKRIDRFMIWSFGITFSATALIIASMRYYR